MRMLLLYILLVAFGCQQTTVNGQQTPFLESEKGCEQRAMSNEQRFRKAQSSQLEAQSLKKTVDCCPLTVDYFENQIRLADSLYKNYLPQYNFEEVKAAVMFFDSCEPRAMSHEQRFRKAQGSQHEAQSLKKTVDCCPLTVDYYENQIRLADSLYKNYLPQYNFEEVKAAVMFFDSLRLTTDNSQRTTDFLESENLKISETEKSCEQRTMSNEPFLESENLKTSESKLETENLKTSKSEKGQKIFQVFNFSDYQIQKDSQIQKNFSGFQFLRFSDSFLCAKAHYYHAVGLTERDDIVGACEHYLTALEIMEEMMAKDKRLKSKGEEKAHGSKFKVHGPRKSVDRCLLTVDNPEDYEKIRFVSLIYTRLGQLFLSENYCDLAILKYKKALEYVEILGNDYSKSQIFKFIGNSFHLYNMSDSALFYYNKSLKTDSNSTNRLDVEKSISKILFERGERDGTYVMMKSNLDKIDNINVRYS